MNRFQFLTGPCLVCKKVRPGAAWGLTPDIAVCDDDWVDDNEAAREALAKAGIRAGLVSVPEVAEVATVEEVLALVDGELVTAEEALGAERAAAEPRVSLIRKLEKRVKANPEAAK